MLQDLRFALRLLNRHRGYTLVAALTVALGVGANTAVFSVADSVLSWPLPFPDADRLFVLRIGDVRTRQAYGFVPRSAVDAARATGLFDGMASASSRATRAMSGAATPWRRCRCRPFRANTWNCSASGRCWGAPSTRPTRERAPSCSRTRHGCVTTAATRPSSAVRSRPRSGRWTARVPTVAGCRTSCVPRSRSIRPPARRRNFPRR